MVEVRNSRQAVEALGAEGTIADVTRVDVSVAALPDTAVEVRTSRVAVEVLGAEGTVADVTRVDVSVAALPDTAVEVLTSRVAVEVLAAPIPKAATTRVDVSVAALPDTAVEVRTSRVSLECLARQGSAGPVVPLALVDDAHVFLHNWATMAELSTSFVNAVSHSPDTGAETRRGLSVKPTRSMKLEWMVQGGLSLVNLERLEVFLRRLTDQRFQVPIYKDQQELAVAYSSGVDTVLIDTSEARFFAGARVAIVQIDACGQPTSFTFHLIDSLTNTSLTFTANLGVAIAAGSYVFPMMDCEVALEVKASYKTARTASVKLTVSEVPGASQLPPLKSDTPTGAEVYDGYPIWFEEPDWKRPVTKGRSRQGRSRRHGRAELLTPEGDRSRQTHKFDITGSRTNMWNALEFFETRRGRLRAFWHIDQDQYFEAVDIDASGLFIGVSVIGDLTDFSEEFDHIGILMNDGSIFVREAITIQEIVTVFRVTMDTAITLGFTPSDVVRVARARLTRFVSDEFKERWLNTGHMSASIDLIEVINEGNFPT